MLTQHWKLLTQHRKLLYRNRHARVSYNCRYFLLKYSTIAIFLYMTLKASEFARYRLIVYAPLCLERWYIRSFGLYIFLLASLVIIGWMKQD